MKKRILSLFLVSIMVFSALPLSALAEIADNSEKNDSTTSQLAETTKDILDGAIYLPITIRDFNNDGILFEYNSSGVIYGSKMRIHGDNASQYGPLTDPSTENQFEKGDAYTAFPTTANILSRYYGDFYRGTSNKAPNQTTVVYNADGSVTLKSDSDAIDPQLHIDLKGKTKSYSYLAMVYKNAKNIVNDSKVDWEVFPYGVVDMAARRKSGEYNSGDTKLVIGSDDWNIVYLPIDTTEAMDGIRFDWTTTPNAEITIAGIYLVDSKPAKSGYDDAADLMYAEGTTFSGSLPASKNVTFAFFRYRNANPSTSVSLKVNGTNFGSTNLKNDSMWHWGYMHPAAGINNGTSYTLTSTGNIEISELYLLNNDDAAALQVLFRTSGSGQIPEMHALEDSNLDIPTSDAIVAKPYYDPTIDYVLSETDKADGYYTRYYAQKDNATLNLYDYISNATYRINCGNGAIGPKYPQFMQIRYKASGFGNNKGLVFNYKTNRGAGTLHQSGASSAVTVDDDGKWHTLVVPLNKSLDWYLCDISTVLPKGATLDIDYINLFNTIAGAEYYVKDWDKLKAKYNNNLAAIYADHWVQSVFSFNTSPNAHKTEGGNGPNSSGGEFFYNYPFKSESEAGKIQASLKDSETGIYDSTNQVFKFPNTNRTSVGGTRGTWIEGLVDNKLGPNGKPVYKKEIVEAIAKALALALTIPYELPDGTRNISALAGGLVDIDVLLANCSDDQKNAIIKDKMNGDTMFDMAEYLRHMIKLNGNSHDTYYYTVGTYDETKAKSDLSFANVSTCMDAAYLLLNGLWSSADEGGYAIDLNDYTNIGLVYDEKNDCHIFRSSYAGINYDKENRLIYNTVIGDKVIEPWMVATKTNMIASTSPASEYRFLSGAIAQSGYGVTHSPYYFTDCNYANTTTMTRYDSASKTNLLDQDLNVTKTESEAQFNGLFYGNDNYNFTVQGHGVFVFDSTKDLFFEFNGDDDVYLYLNNELVLDLGGAHGRTDKRVKVTELLNTKGIEDGEVVSFDFFQAERHGYGSNFAILTNIPIVTPDIEVDKTAEQENETPDTKDDALEYNATVNPDAPISYAFSLENIAENKEYLHNFTFTDNKASVELSKDLIKLNDHTTINDITVTVVYYEYDEADTKKENLETRKKIEITYGKDTPGWSEDMLKQILSGDILLEYDSIDPDHPYRGKGLYFGDSIKISGINYVFTEDDKKEGSFQNTVVVTTETVDLTGIAETLVKQDDFVVILPNDKIYLWADHARTFNVSEFFIDESIGRIPYENIGKTIEDISYAAAVTGVSEVTDGLAATFTTGDDIRTQSFTVSSTKVGSLTFKYNVKLTITDTKAEEGTEPTVENMTYTVVVYTYDANDISFALDYGLPMVVNTDDYLKGDTVNLRTNTAASSKVTGYATSQDVSSPKSEAYGTISELGADSSITYTPIKFIEGRDYVYVKIGVSEEFGSNTPYAVTKGVEMWKKVSFVPASVVYYEEKIGVNYKSPAQTFELDNVNRTQSADGELQYGYDNAYNDNNATQSGNSDAVPPQYYIIWYKEIIQAGTGTGGFDNQGNTYNFSNNSYAYINTKSDAYQSFWNNKTNNQLNAAIEFTFNGTGFEIISYTNLNTATVVVDVFDADGNKVDTKYVFTKYTNGQLQQVPIIDFEGLTYGRYSVKVYAVPAVASTATDFYLDGIRIFDPLGKGDDGDSALREETYLEKENNADIFDIRELLLASNKVALAGTKIDANKTAYSFIGNGTTLVERKGKGPGMIGEGYLNESIADADALFNYATVGPNNEIYLSAGNTVAVLLTANDASSAKTFQVEAKRLGETNSLLAYVVVDEEGNYSYRLAEVKSYTAMYFEIDISDCPKDEKGNYVVIIGTALNDAELDAFNGTISLTSFKVKGYTMSAPDISVKATTANAASMSEFAEIVMEGTEVISGHTAKYNPDLYITSVTSSVSATVGGKVKFNVVASAETTEIIVRDGNGEIVNSAVLSVRTIGNNKIFTVEMDAPANVGTYNYAVVAEDSEGRLSEEAHFTATAIN